MSHQRRLARFAAALRHWPLRLRLTAAFTAAMAAVLIAVTVATLAQFRGALDESLDTALRDALQSVQASADPRTVSLDSNVGVRQVLRVDGTLVTGSVPGNRPLLTATEIARARQGPWRADRSRIAGLAGPGRLAAGPTDDGRGVAVVGISVTARDASLADLRRELSITLPLVLLAAAAGAYLLARAALRPVERMRAHAATITATEFPQPLPVPPGGDEIARLGRTLNAMLWRLHGALSHERRFVADASHELRTPLSLLTSELELAAARPRSAQELRASLLSALQETHRLNRLANDLLLLDRTDTGQLGPSASAAPIPLAPVIDTVVQRLTAAEPGTITVSCAPALAIYADADDVTRALTNLLVNAIGHGAAPIEVSARLREPTAATGQPNTGPSSRGILIEVRDRGPGFEPAFLPHAFERFSRADNARTSGGAGLGLAIAAALVARHGGSMQARNTNSTGAAVTIHLPGTLTGAGLGTPTAPTAQG